MFEIVEQQGSAHSDLETREFAGQEAGRADFISHDSYRLRAAGPPPPPPACTYTKWPISTMSTESREPRPLAEAQYFLFSVVVKGANTIRPDHQFARPLDAPATPTARLTRQDDTPRFHDNKTEDSAAVHLTAPQEPLGGRKVRRVRVTAAQMVIRRIHET